MRVLVADQETDMLEQIARAFEVDVATSKATCVDLLRANEFDVLVACERLSDGGGLELRSHVGQRWPYVIRILAIEPERRALLKGKLGPFKLFETISYPITEDKLEAALTRASEALSRDYAEEPPARSAPLVQPAPTLAPQVYSRAAAQSTPRANQASPTGTARGAVHSAQDTRAAPPSRGFQTPSASAPGARGGAAPAYDPNQGARAGTRPSAAPPAYEPTQRGGGAAAASGAPRASGPSSRADASNQPRGIPGARASAAPGAASRGGQSFAQGSRPRSAADDPAYPPLPRKGSKIVPLGSPETQFKILPHDYHEQHMPGTLPKRDEPAQKAPTLQEKAAALASGAMKGVSELVRQIKPPAAPPPAPKAPPGKKR
jgi:hypothetical protein